MQRTQNIRVSCGAVVLKIDGPFGDESTDKLTHFLTDNIHRTLVPALRQLPVADNSNRHTRANVTKELSLPEGGTLRVELRVEAYNAVDFFKLQCHVEHTLNCLHVTVKAILRPETMVDDLLAVLTQLGDDESIFADGSFGTAAANNPFGSSPRWNTSLRRNPFPNFGSNSFDGRTADERLDGMPPGFLADSLRR